MSHSQRLGSVDTRKRNEAAGRGVRRLLTGVLSAIVASAIALAIYGEATGATPCGLSNVPRNTPDACATDPCTGAPSGGCTNQATTDDPIALLSGAVIERVTDLSLPGIGLGWSHTRTYSSVLDAADSGQTLGTFQGDRWEVDLLTCFVTWDTVPDTDEIHFFADATHKRVFTFKSTTGNCDTYDPPEDYRATLKHYKCSGYTGTADDHADTTTTSVRGEEALELDNDELKDCLIAITFASSVEYRRITGNTAEKITWEGATDDPTGKPFKILDRVVLTFTDSQEKLEFAGNGNWWSGHEGVLRTRVDAYGNEVSYAFMTDHGGRIYSMSLTTGHRVVYDHIDIGDLAGAIREIEVLDASDQVLQRAYYYYVGDGVYDCKPDCGSTGDLVLVHTLRRAAGDPLEEEPDDDDFSIQRYTHYRYYTDGDADGKDHQLKMVLEPGAVAAIMADWSLSIDDLLDTGDTDDLGGPGTPDKVEEYACRSFTYYVTVLTTEDASIDTPWGGSYDLDNYYTGDAAIEFDETGFVKSEMVEECTSCGGGGSGLKRTYYYMKFNKADPTPADVTRIIVEDTTDASNVEVRRTIWGLNKDGVMLREVTIVDSSSAKYWCKSIIVGTSGKETNRILQRRMPSAHKALVTSNAHVAEFLDPSTDSYDDNRLSTDAGLIYVYEYNEDCIYDNAGTKPIDDGTDGYLTGTLLKNGRSDEAFYVSATDYKDFDSSGGVKILPWKQYSYPVQDTARGGVDPTVTYHHSFHNSDPATQLATRKVTHVAVPGGENGENSEDVTAESYDSDGQLRWTINAEGHVAYYEYDNDGRLVYQVVDINTDIPPAGPTPPNPPETPVNFATDSGLNLLTQYAYDEQGRQTKVTDPEGIVTYTVHKDNQTLVFPAWKADGGDSQSLLPIQVTETDQDGQVTEQFTVDPAEVDLDGSNLPEGMNAKDQTKYITWTRYRYTDAGQLEHVDRYHNIPAEGTGDPETDYYRTTYTYDTQGRRWKVTTPDETIAITQFDALGRAKASWMGTNDANSSVDEPDGGGAPNNMKQVSTTYYDTATSSTLVVGDGNVTRGEAYYGSGGSDYYTTDYVYDWRNRLLKTRGPNSVAVVRTLDNLGRTKEAVTYANTTFNTTSWDVESDTNANRRAKSETNYDKRGHVYQSIVHEVMPSTGDVTDSLTTKYWYDADGRLIKTQDPNTFVESTTYCLFTKNTYDGAGRLTDTYLAYDDESSYADAEDADLIGDIVIEQSKAYYDKDGRVWLTTRLRRNDNASTGDTGALSVGTNPKGRPEYTVNWYDDARRLTSTVFYGTNNGVVIDDKDTSDFDSDKTGTLAYVDGPPSPDSADYYIVTKYVYDDTTGRVSEIYNNRNKYTELTYDDLGRRTKVVENSDGTAVAETDTDANRTTEYVYDSAGRLSTMRAKNPKGSGNDFDDQETKFYYDPVCHDANPLVYRNDLVWAVIYPDSDDTDTGSGAGNKFGNGNDSAFDRVLYNYDRLGRRTTVQDQRGTVHEYTFDSAGRLEHDKVTTPGTGVDDYVKRITRAYDDIGRVQSITSHGHVTTSQPRNGVKFTYDGWGNVSKSQQDHRGDAGAGDPDVDYVYEDGGTGAAKYVRLARISYPSTRDVYYNYPGTGLGVGRALSRLDNIASVASPTAAQKYTEYAYLGAGTVIELKYPAVTVSENPLVLTYGGSGTYGGLDRFDRVVDQKWQTSAGNILDRFQYAYDRSSNRISRDVTPTNAPPSGHEKDEFYAYDGLDRLKEFHRGSLVEGTITAANAKFSQEWTELEALGNWRKFKWEPDGGNNSWKTQDRKHNDANEIDDDNIHGNTPSSTITGTEANWIDPKHDAAGNMTLSPRPGGEATDTEALLCVYDAWNRLVAVWQDNGGGSANGTLTTTGEDKDTLLAEYRYDGLHRRIAKLLPNDSNWDRTDYYFTTSWQVVEERVATDVTTENRDNPATEPTFQYVWDIRYIDAPVLRDENKDPGDNTCDDGDPDERLYYCNDANFNVTALVRTDGIPVERYCYDAYGKVTILNGAFPADKDGMVSQWYDDSVQNSDVDNEILYCGYRFDTETGLYQVRHRHYHPTLGRWLQRDPIGYADGMNLYEYVRSQPLGWLDPWGLAQRMGSMTEDDIAMISAGIRESLTLRIWYWTFTASDPDQFARWQRIIAAARKRARTNASEPKQLRINDPKQLRLRDCFAQCADFYWYCISCKVQRLPTPLGNDKPGPCQKTLYYCLQQCKKHGRPQNPICATGGRRGRISKQRITIRSAPPILRGKNQFSMRETVVLFGVETALGAVAEACHGGTGPAPAVAGGLGAIGDFMHIICSKSGATLYLRQQGHGGRHDHMDFITDPEFVYRMIVGFSFAKQGDKAGDWIVAAERQDILNP